MGLPLGLAHRVRLRKCRWIFPRRIFERFMTSTSPTAVFAIVSNSLRAESIVSEIRLAGFAHQDVSVLFPDMKATSKFAVMLKPSRAPEGAAVGASTGVLLGGMAGWLVGLGTIMVPGVGALIAAGPFVAALSGMAVGATAGGLSGALVGLGFDSHDARFYAGLLAEGNILIAVHTEDADQIRVVREIFERADAFDIGITHETAG